jgi:hypothetical protein
MTMDDPNDSPRRIALAALKMKSKALATELLEFAGELAVATTLLVRGLRLHLAEFNVENERDPKGVW